MEAIADRIDTAAEIEAFESLLKRLLGAKWQMPKPRALTAERLRQLDAATTRFGNKTDGTRFLLCVCSLGAICRSLEGVLFRIRNAAKTRYPFTTLLDGEWVAAPHSTYWAFDVLYEDNRSLHALPFRKRESRIAAAVNSVRKALGSAIGWHLQAKTFFSAIQALSHSETKESGMPCDGWILANTLDSWMPGQPETAVTKWKPNHTVDVLAQPATKPDVYEIWYLQTDGCTRAYLEGDQKTGKYDWRWRSFIHSFIHSFCAARVANEQARKDCRQAAKSGAPFVVECAWQPSANEWVIIKTRPEKSHPNYTSVIEETIALAHQNIDFDSLRNHFLPVKKRRSPS